jgi:hypothetical protein
MAIQAALNSTQKGYLRASSWRAQQYLSLAPNTNVYTAQVDGTPSGNVFASLTMDNTSGTASDAWVGFTVLISRTDDKEAAFWRGRVRKAIDGATLYINETSADIQDDDYIFIIQDVALHEKLPREASGTRYNDWDITFRQLPPVINNLQAAYAGFISGGALQIQFQPSAVAATSGASISSYQFTMPTGYGSVAAGALNTNDVTIDFNEGVWIVRLVVTDSGGRTATRYIPVFAHGETTTPALGFGGADITAGRDGFGASVAAFDGVEDVLDNTLAVMWRANEFYGATEVNLGNNIDMAGRFRSESTQVVGETGMYETRFTIEGPAQQMRSVASQLITCTNESSPSAWDEIADLTPWRALVYMLAEFSTFFHLWSLSFDATAGTYEVQALDADPSNLWDMAQALLTNIDKRLEFRHDGHGFVSIKGNYAASATRDTLPTVIDLETQDYLNIAVEHAHGPTVGQIIGFGAYYTTGSGAVAPLASIAPGHAQGAGAEKSQRADFILEADSTKAAAQAELGRRLGDHFAAVNPKDRISADLPDGYYALVPSVGTWYTWTLTEANTGRKDYDSGDRWTLAEISFGHDNATGARVVSAVFERETSADDAGVSAQAYTLANPYAAVDAQFDYFPWSSFAPFPDDPASYLPPDITLEQQHPFDSDPLKVFTPVPRDGNTVLAGDRDADDSDDSGLYLTFTYLSAAPEWFDISPASGVEIKHSCFKSNASREAYCLTYDSNADDSYFYYTEDAFASPVAWQFGTTLSGQWDYIRVAEGGVYVVRGNTTTNLVSRDTWSVDSSVNAYQYGTYTLEDGVTYVVRMAGAVQYDYPAHPGYKADAQYRTFDDFSSYVRKNYAVFNNGDSPDADDATYDGATHTYDFTRIGAGATIGIKFPDSTYTDNVGSFSITLYEVVAAAANAQVRYSTDDGDTFAGAVTIGSTPGNEQCGFDTIRAGATSVGCALNQVKIATAAGGVYSDEGNAPADLNPVMIDIPLWKVGADGGAVADQNIDTETPEYILGTTGADGSGNRLFVVNSSGDTGIQPASGYAAFNPNAIATCDVNGLHIAVFMTSVPAGEIHLFTSDDGGSSWGDRGAMAESSKWLRMRSQSVNQLFFVQGTDGLGYSADFGANLITKDAPGGRVPQFIEVYG